MPADMRKGKSLFATTSNSFSTGEGVTITPNDVSGLPTGNLVLTFDREVAGKVERIKGAISGSNFVVASGGRGYDGTTEQAHTSPNVEYIYNGADQNDAVDAFVAEHSVAGVHDVTKVAMLAGTQTFTGDKTFSGTTTITSPVLNTGISGTAFLDEDDMASNSATKVASQQSIKAYVDANAGSTTGWSSSSDTWTYASASTFTISGVDRTTVYTKGTKLKFTQTTAKYAVVVSSSFSTNTTVTIAVNTDYVIANAAITSPYYSYQEKPQGYPTRFNFTPAWTNLTVGSGSIPYAFYSVNGDRVFVQVKFIFGSGSSIGGAIYLTVPVAFTTITGIADQDAMLSQALMLDSGTALYVGGCQYDITNSKVEARPYQADTVYAKYTAASSTVPMTWTTNDALTMNFSYQI